MNMPHKRCVAAYARVSTDQDEQFTSYEAQIDYYTKYIKANDEWEFVNVYTDEGISGTSSKRRDGFKQMIDDALKGKIDLIVTKSISRFARNTVDALVNIRKLKDKELLISNLLLVKEKLLDVNLSKPMEQAKNEMLVVSGLCDQHIFNKEKKQMKSEVYMEEYVDLVKRFTEAQDKYKKLMAEQVDKNRQSIKLQAFISEIKVSDTLNLEFNEKLFNLTIINIKVYKDSHLEFNFKDGSTINIEL